MAPFVPAPGAIRRGLLGARSVITRSPAWRPDLISTSELVMSPTVTVFVMTLPSAAKDADAIRAGGPAEGPGGDREDAGRRGRGDRDVR